jgi:antitoxin (DNA-binding transcriptional repressor) of toxin-antitoxin stability system
MTMKTINVSELKTHLSRYLRMASRGTRIVVTDRDDPIAQLGPLEPTAAIPWPERLSREGGLRLGSQDWAALRVTSLGQPVDIQAALRSVREDVR